MYALEMEVGVSELRANLSDWIERARSDGEVVITERGIPVARLVGIELASTIEQLLADGTISRPKRPKEPLGPPIKARPGSGPISDIIREQRDDRERRLL